jgi:hypothetical protein
MGKGRFVGGLHTQEKLEVLRAYLQFYAQALKKQRFSLLYIDAFAGSGDYELDFADAGLFAGFAGYARQMAPSLIEARLIFGRHSQPDVWIPLTPVRGEHLCDVRGTFG